MKQISALFFLLSLFSVFAYSQNYSKEELSKKIEEATPKALPQTPVVKKSKSDIEDEGLKGKVKAVIESSEDLSGTWVTKGIKLDSETFYDENGNRVKDISYDYRGNPSNVTVYGYINGMRVSKGGFINYPYNPPPMMMSSSEKAVSEKPVDTRYSVRYEYQYDEKGFLKEEIGFRNNGEMINKTVYSYDGNKLEKSTFNKEGKLYGKTIDVLDAKSNIIEHSFVYLDGSKPDNITVYTYDSFDEKGNWTKRTIKRKEVENNSNKQTHYIEYRKITYYP